MRRAAITLLVAGMSAASPAAAGAPGPQRLGDPPVTNEAERYVAAPIATGSDGRPVALIQSGATTIETAVAVDDSGGGVLAAILVGGTSRDRHDRVVAWPLRPGGGIGARRALSRPGAHATGPLGVTVDGRVTWRQAQGSYAARIASAAP